MAIKRYNPVTPTTRVKTTASFEEVTTRKITSRKEEENWWS